MHLREVHTSDKLGWNLVKLFKKLYSKILNLKKNSIIFFMHNVPSKIASLLKFWWASGFQWANRQNLTKIHVVFWTEYALNEKIFDAMCSVA